MVKQRLKKGEYDRINSIVDIAKVVGKVVDLKHMNTYYKGLCPFHDETRPSFIVNSKDSFTHPNTYHCFGGQCETRHGNAVNFVSRYYNIQPHEAIEFLSKEYSTPLQYEEYKLTAEEIRHSYLSGLNTAVTNSLNKNLISAPRSSDVKKYLYDRGVIDDDIEKWKIGYGDNKFVRDSFLGKIFNEKLVDHNDFRDIDLDRNSFFTGKIIFPLFDISGNAIAFSNRIFFYHENKEIQKEREDELLQDFSNSKYVNTSVSSSGYNNKFGSLLFRSKASHLYGLNIARQHIRKAKGVLIIVEGMMDVIACHRHGIYNVAGLMSTAFSKETVKLLEKCYVRKVVFCLDADKGGEEGVLGILRHIQRGDIEVNFEVGVASLPRDYGDPDSYLLLGSADGFKKVIEKNKCISEHLIDHEAERMQLNTLSEKFSFIHSIKKELDTSRTLSRLEKAVIVDSLSDKLSIPSEVIKEFTGVGNEGMPDVSSLMLSEKIVIAEIIKNEEARPQLLNLVDQDDYSQIRNKILHKMVVELVNKQKPVDFNIISIKGQEERLQGRFYDLDYLHELDQVARMNVEFHAEKIVDFAKKRRLVDIGTRITRSAVESDDMQVVIGNVSKDLYKLNFSADQDAFKSPTDDAIDYAMEMRRRMEEKGIRHGIYTGLKILDNATQGFFPGQTILILARTSDGKTALAQNMVCHMSLKQDPPISVYYANMEMPSDQMMDRMMSIDTGIPARKISSGNINDPVVRKKLFHAIENYGARRSLHMQMITDLTVSKLASILKYQIECNGVQLAVVDYIQLMGVDKDYRGMATSEQLNIISGGITALAKTLNIPIIIIAQANRDTITNNKGRPELHHIYGCDKFSHDVDIAISLQPKTHKKMADEGFLSIAEMIQEGYTFGVDNAEQKQYEKFRVSKLGNIILHILKNRKGQKDLHYGLFFHKFKLTFKEVTDQQLIPS
jgi:DNA primase